MELGTAYQARALRGGALLALAWCASLRAAPLDVTLLTVDGKPMAGAVIMLRATRPARPSLPPVKAVMDQVDRTFVPHVLVVPVGSSVDFPNSDTVSHQVYSFSPTKKFQLPLYRGSPNPPVLFDRAGVVTLGCNIHDAMRAYIFVVDGQYSGRSDSTGNWSVPAAEPGEYQALVWHPLSREMQPLLEMSVSVPPGNEHQRIRLQMASALRLRPESAVPPNWDAY